LGWGWWGWWGRGGGRLKIRAAENDSMSGRQMKKKRNFFKTKPQAKRRLLPKNNIINKKHQEENIL
jgi:hypothetical protein